MALECKCAFGAKIWNLIFVFLLDKYAPEAHFVDPKIRVRRQLCCSGVVAEVMAHRFSAPSCSQWLWGNVRKRSRRSESRWAHPFRRSEALYDLSNTSTLKNLGTLLWHSNVSAPSARQVRWLFFSAYLSQDVPFPRILRNAIVF